MGQHCLVFLNVFSCGFFAVLWRFFEHKINERLSCEAKIPLLLIYGAILTVPQVQRGEQPDDFKPMPSIGKGVEEIRVWDDSCTYRVIYSARLIDAVYVLHAFQKKSQATAKRDIEIAKKRYTELMRASQ